MSINAFVLQTFIINKNLPKNFNVIGQLYSNPSKYIKCKEQDRNMYIEYILSYVKNMLRKPEKNTVKC